MTATESIAQEIVAPPHRKTLVVEDRRGVGLRLRCVLANRGVEAEIVHNGAETIVRWRDAAAD